MDKINEFSVLIDKYISEFPQDVQEKLAKLRSTIREAAPEAKEKISYQMPAVDLNGILVYYAAHKSHIGFYPTASGIENFKDKLSEYKMSKGAVQFPLDKPVPYELVSEIVKFRAAENLKKAEEKSKKKK
jgi:uncharacterized protein YdhG (YjbR/CyaY superfamily)